MTRRRIQFNTRRFVPLLLLFLGWVIDDTASLAGTALRAYNAVSKESISAYGRDGVSVVRNVLCAEDVELLRNECDLAVFEPSPFAEDISEPLPESGWPTYFTDSMRTDFRSRLREWVEEGAVAAVAGRLSGSSTERFLQDQFFVKPLGSGGGDTHWHQDASYCAVKGENVISVFVALDDIEDPAECLRFVPRSHAFLGDDPTRPVPLPRSVVDAAMRNGRGGAKSIGSSRSSNSDRERGEEDEEDDLSGSLGWSLKAGDCVAFAGATVHGGPGSWGRALTLRYIGDGVAW